MKGDEPFSHAPRRVDCAVFTPEAKDRLTLEQMRLSRKPTPHLTSRIALE